MPSFVIYQGEAGLRSENHRLKQRNAQLEAENARLRALVGEPALVEMAKAESVAAAQQARLGPPSQSFNTGECAVTIGPAPQKAVALNPLVARARGIKQPATPTAPERVIIQPTDLPVSTQPTDAKTEEEENLPSTRFQLIEMHK